MHIINIFFPSNQNIINYTDDNYVVKTDVPISICHHHSVV